jgi:hypothetical protein
MVSDQNGGQFAGANFHTIENENGHNTEISRSTRWLFQSILNHFEFKLDRVVWRMKSQASHGNFQIITTESGDE